MTARTALLALVLATRLARADDRADAESLFRTGEKAFDAGQYADAADEFEQAYAKLPLPAIAFSLAQAHRLQYFVDNQPRHLQRAVELYQAYIAAQQTGGRVGDAATNLAQIEPILTALIAGGAKVAPEPPAAALTKLAVTADVKGARVTIDGERGTTPFVHAVTPGEHAITVEADGYQPETRTAIAIPDAIVPVEVTLVAKPARLTVTGPRGASVSVDARALGDAPITAAEIPAGHHVVVVSARGRVPFVRDAELARDQAITLAPELGITRQRRAVPWVVAGAGALAIAAGITAIYAHEADADALDQRARLGKGGAEPDVVTRYNADLDDRATRVHATEWLGAASGAVLVTGALLYLFDHPAAEAPPRLAPVVGAKSAGLVLGGRF